MIAFPLIRLVGLKAATASSRQPRCDVCLQSTIPKPLHEITQLGAIRFEDEVNSQAARGPRLSRAGDGHQRSSGANHARGSLRNGPTGINQNPCDPTIPPGGPPPPLQVDLMSIMTSDDGAHAIAEWEPTYGSGYILASTVDGTNFLPVGGRSGSYGLTVNKILGPDGVTYTPANYTPYTENIVAFNQSDPEGNSITVSTSGWTDTLGRLIPGSTYGPGTGTSSPPSVPPTGGDPFPGVTASSTQGCTNGATAARVWNVPTVNGQSAPYILCYSNVTVTSPSYPSPYVTGNEELNGSSISASESVLTQVVLPNQTSYTFAYNPDLTLSSITLPTGGVISYTYQTLNWNTGQGLTEDLLHSFTRAVATRTVTNTDGSQHTWSYAFTNLAYPGQSTATITDPAGNQMVHSGGTTQYYQGSQASGTLLKTVVTTYATGDSFPFRYPGKNNGSLYGALSPIGPIQSVQTTLPNGKVSLVQNNMVTGTTPVYCYSVYTYNPNNPPYWDNPFHGQCQGPLLQVQSTNAYAYGQGSPGVLVRTTTTNYEWQASSAYASANMISLPSSVVVADGSGNTISTTTYGYDENNGSPQGVYGNLTSTSVTGPKGGYSKTSTVYNTQGMPVTSIDGNGNNTTDTYADSSAAAPTTVCLPPTTNGSANHCSTYTWDADTGKMLTYTDQNSVLTKYSYNDPLGRLTEIDAAVETPQETTQTFAYPTPNVTDMDADELTLSDQKLKSSITVDGFSRQIHSTDPTGATVDTTYDSVGNVASTSNPYFTTSEPTYGITSYAYDALGRKTYQCQQDNSSSPTTTCTPGNSFQKWTYNSDSVTFQDEDGNQWTRTFDAQGNLVKVVEPTAYETDYVYDAVGNLDSVTQCGGPCPSSSSVTRTFTYDSLSRLLSSTNPESGTISYTYDDNSNVITKMAPAPNQTGSTKETITYTYDQLNRLQWKHYSDGVTIAAGFGYDGYDATGHALSGETYADGRLSQTSENTAHAISIFSYDPMGRVIKKESCIPGDCNYDVKVNATYNLASNLATLSNGSPTQPITLTYAYDTGDRLSSITSNYTGTNHPSTLFEANSTSPASYGPVGLQYAFLGAITSSAATVILNRAYDNRLRSIYEGDTNSAGSPLYSYCIPGPNNSHCTSSSVGYAPNGNVAQVSDSVMGNWTYQSPGYDTLNRLANGAATSGPYSGEYGCWQYDAFGNRTSEAISTTACTNSPPPTSWAHYNTNNQVTATGLMPSGYTYDAAGNVINDGVNQYLYDGENRICAVKSDSSPYGMTGYIYDASGARVGKWTPQTFSCNLPSTPAVINGYVVGLNGEQLTETTGGTGWLHTHVFANGQLLATYSSTDTLFELSDWLGTRRADVGASKCETTWQSLPYGDGLALGPSSNCSNSSELHFTGKERDAESGLDYFGARYYGSSMGRFLSPDYDDTGDAIEPVPYAALSNPQSLNLYGYVQENPLISIDPSGHIPCNWVANITITVTPDGTSTMNQSPDDCPTTDDWFSYLFRPTLIPLQNKPQTTQIPQIGPPSYPVGSIGPDPNNFKQDYCAKQALLDVGKNAIAWDLMNSFVDKANNAFDKFEGLDNSDAPESNSGSTLPSSPGESAASGTEHAADFVATSATAQQFVRAALRSADVKVSVRAVGRTAGAVGKYAGYAGATYTLYDAVKAYEACMSQ